MRKIVILATFLLISAQTEAAELRFAGVLGNSGEAGASLATFSGTLASGFSPVLDDANTIWERGGSKQLNRYALDGRLLATFELPESTDRFGDQMTRVDDLLLFEIRSSLYAMPLDALSGTKPERLAGRAEIISSNSREGRVALLDQGELFWFTPSTGNRTPIAKTDFRISSLHLGEDSTVFAFGGGKVYAWQDGRMLTGFPRGFHGARPQKIGKWWYSHAWHGTINRYNDQFEPEPGVVLGGASGSFIGYLPRSVDITHGTGLVHVRDDIFAVSGHEGIVQLLRWQEDETQFEVVRRLGPLMGLAALALDAEGNLWTTRGSWRWTDSPAAPHTLGDVEPSATTQPVVLGGKTLVILKNHYGNVQWARGPIIDSSGWAHLETKGTGGLTLDKSGAAATAFETSGGKIRMLVTSSSGKAFEFGISEDGHMQGTPIAIEIPGLQNCTSLAWFEGRLLAADRGDVVAFERADNGRWLESSRWTDFGNEVYIHSDGLHLAVADTQKDLVHLYESLKNRVATYSELNQPRHVAVSGNRVAVYDAGNQRVVRLEYTDISVRSPRRVRRLEKGVETLPVSFATTDYINLGRPGGLACWIALNESPRGLALSVRADAPQLKLGVANSTDAFILTGGTNFQLPPGDWSNLRLAIALKTSDQQERIGLLDHRAIHVPFSEDPSTWAPFDFAGYRELVAERRQQIRIEFDQPNVGKATIVIENEAGQRVRNLVSGRSFPAGRHSVVWDGLDEEGRLVSPGNYRWRGVTHGGIKPQYKMHFANGGEETTHPWGTNHGLLHHVVSDGKQLYFAAPVTEGGWALLALDANGNFVQGYEHQQGFGIGHNAIAVDNNYLYCAQDGFGWGGTRDVDFNSDDWKATWKLTVARYDIQTGKVVEFPGNKRAFEADTMEVGPGSNHRDLRDFNLGGLAVLDGKLYVGSRSKNAVRVFNANTGELLDSIPLQCVRHLAVGSEVIAATNQGVVRLSDKKLLVPSGEMDITGLTIAPNGDILVSDGRSHQIHRFTSNGKRIATIGKPGGHYKGAYEPSRMVNPAGLAFGPDGKLWVTEKRWNPKRVLAWDLEKNKVVYEKFGMPHYGGDGSGFDPENPRRWIGLGCFWDVDIAAGTARPTHIMAMDEAHFGTYHPQSYSFFREAGRTFLCTRGKIAVISEVFEDGTIRDIAACCGTHHFAYGCSWRPPKAYIDAFYARWPGKRSEEKPGRGAQGKPWAGRVAGVLWVDRNADGERQQEEFVFTEEGVHFADGAWGHMQDSLTFYFPAAVGDQVKVVAIRPTGFQANGIPDYPTLDEAIQSATDVNLTPGYKRSGVATARDRFGRFIFNSDPEMNAYAADGRHLWTYPNKWSNVHGSHDAPLPETGVMQGTMAILGMAPFDDRADVFFLNGNHGRCFLLTSDGLYLDEMFTDVRISYLKNEYRLGGEIFGGMFDRSQRDGKYYVQIGHGPYRIYELCGINQARRMSGRLVITKQQIATAERQSRRKMAEKQVEKTFIIPGKLAWDQNGRYKTKLTAAIMGEQLHLTYGVQDPSPWINNGRDWTTLFATGDTVDLQIGTDAAADPKRRKPVLGDKRLVISPYEGKPIAVLYEHVKPGGTSPIEFTSPWRGAKVDDVRRITDVEINVTTSNSGYLVEVKVPLKTLGIATADQALRADFGVTFGDASGTDTQLRSYWSNRATMLVDDIPGEIMLHPNLWGELLIEQAKN